MAGRYANIKSGFRSDLQIHVRSGWEANYCRYLNFLIDKGQVYKWEFEPDTFWFLSIKRGVRSYLPDFKVWDTETSEPYYIEIKGYMDAKSKTKLKRMAKYYPNVRVDLIAQKQYMEIKRKLSALMPEWE